MLYLCTAVPAVAFLPSSPVAVSRPPYESTHAIRPTKTMIAIAYPTTIRHGAVVCWLEASACEFEFIATTLRSAGLSRRRLLLVKISPSCIVLRQFVTTAGSKQTATEIVHHGKAAPIYAHTPLPALATTRSITRIFATALDNGAGTGVSSRIARANASA